MRYNILEIALRELNHQIVNEVEFPIAFYRVCCNLKLTNDECNELQFSYDQQGVK
jgi:hypothetical protein